MEANSSQSIVGVQEHCTQSPRPSTMETETHVDNNEHDSEKVNKYSDSAANKINKTSSSEDVPLECSFFFFFFGSNSTQNSSYITTPSTMCKTYACLNTKCYRIVNKLDLANNFDICAVESWLSPDISDTKI